MLNAAVTVCLRATGKMHATNMRRHQHGAAYFTQTAWSGDRQTETLHIRRKTKCGLWREDLVFLDGAAYQVPALIVA